MIAFCIYSYNKIRKILIFYAILHVQGCKKRKKVKKDINFYFTYTKLYHLQFETSPIRGAMVETTVTGNLLALSKYYYYAF